MNLSNVQARAVNKSVVLETAHRVLETTQSYFKLPVHTPPAVYDDETDDNWGSGGD